MMSELKIDSHLIDSKKEDIHKLYEDITTFSQGYITNDLFSTSYGKSVDSYNEMLATLVTTTKYLSTTLDLTMSYLELIKDRFQEFDQTQASKLTQE